MYLEKKPEGISKLFILEKTQIYHPCLLLFLSEVKCFLREIRGVEKSARIRAAFLP